MKNSHIEWCHHTFNPWIGCTKVSPGCLHCYAETLMDTRYGRVKWGRGNDRSRTSSGNWKQPRRWNKEAAQAGERPRVFCASLADWLDMEVPHGWRVDLLNLIEATPNLDWLLLTKRPESWSARMHEAAYAAPMAARWINGEPPPNVWLGTSAEDQQRWDERLPELLRIPARVRFVSAEPLLGPIWMGDLRPDWLIVGGESGPRSRTMDPLWVESLCDQCVTPQVAFLFKQWGGVDKKATGRELDGRTWDELPEVNAFAGGGGGFKTVTTERQGAVSHRMAHRTKPCPPSDAGSPHRPLTVDSTNQVNE